MVDLAGQHSNPASQQGWTDDLYMTLARLPYKLKQAIALLSKLKNQEVAERQRAKTQHQVRLSEADIIKLVDEYRGGMTVMELAQRYGIHRTTVMGHLRRKGVPKQGRKLTCEQIAQVKYLRKMGMSYEKIGKVFGVNGETIAKYTKA